MAGLNILGEFLFGIDVRILVAAGFLLIVLLAFLWDAIAIPLLRLWDWLRGADHSEVAEPIRERAYTNGRRSDSSRERRAARIEARRVALRAKRNTPDSELGG